MKVQRYVWLIAPSGKGHIRYGNESTARCGIRVGKFWNIIKGWKVTDPCKRCAP